jgi:glyoxylase-like metal-dependent hydrolase (beta-lactamase superfamily II)
MISREDAMIANQTFQRMKLGFTWCYLVKCSGGYLLIDTSYPAYFDSFRKHMADMGRDMAEIKYLLLTHHHDDHSGFAADLVKETGCRVIVHRNAIPPLGQGRGEGAIEPINWRVKFVFSLFALFHRVSTFPPVTLDERDIVLSGDDSDLLKSIGMDGKIVYTPGHCGDCISVVLSDGSAFVGDAAMNFLRFTGIRHRPVYVEDINAVYESWQRLLEEGARVIYPSHGKPFSAQELVRQSL